MEGSKIRASRFGAGLAERQHDRHCGATAFRCGQARSLPEGVRIRLMHLTGNRLTTEGELAIEAKRFRTQEINRQDAILDWWC